MWLNLFFNFKKWRNKSLKITFCVFLILWTEIHQVAKIPLIKQHFVDPFSFCDDHFSYVDTRFVNFSKL
jgi:hypothetical protein